MPHLKKLQRFGTSDVGPEGFKIQDSGPESQPNLTPWWRSGSQKAVITLQCFRIASEHNDNEWGCCDMFELYSGIFNMIDKGDSTCMQAFRIRICDQVQDLTWAYKCIPWAVVFSLFCYCFDFCILMAVVFPWSENGRQTGERREIFSWIKLWIITQVWVTMSHPLRYSKESDNDGKKGASSLANHLSITLYSLEVNPGS